ncbi:class I SAM-dependent methyltransferase [Kitasatospora sp. NPDC001660]
MSSLDHQINYWDTTGTEKTFTHPVELTWLSRLGPDARILDYGCGYGRLAGLLLQEGFRDVEGVDFSPKLVDRAREQHPGARFTVLTEPPALGRPDGSVDAALLIAVLTCIPTDDGQRGLIDELRRVLRPGGLLYLSDMCLQEDERNRSRYARFAAQYGTYGVFETSDGAVCRHHRPEWLRELLAGFDVVAEREVVARTMSGNPARITQLLAARA